ncbi:diacylglycerol kinase [Pseudidiomarina terrestris]|uniref:Diacylglycerol kinase n=1 Tax=Pseudidiomarina terrestris TaxID=2820060 RepID=A0AAW7QYA7_9GAMM|nr:MULTISPECIES: diacylglycerol kinase [unclassified Pseudidiomarina]MDN7124724.1 diacylglycerol kinase [Pseudidiomarina sp. 1APP75-32.1]MDN7125781.1 diacylglycerol kinase [Pseudidiomarina sp. 1APR75-33.1]MDN7129802.1 diacylglycerol kinase [Pseudidiomarina sp. 1APR75-15]MDN7136421.1 diacylglycerol kinase [Pseudidiomarina sp. 1ASP75-5]MDN7137941.1 diacylglycerol kinase [Pseudidiomarina sp. 1ASP75-14]
MKPPQHGLMRIVRATRNSLRGFRFALQSEAAVRQDCLLALVLIPLALWLGQSGVERALLILPVLILLIVEFLNSAIEATIDRISPDLHELSGKAKDIASTAVMFSLITIAVTWLLVLLN